MQCKDNGPDSACIAQMKRQAREKLKDLMDNDKLSAADLMRILALEAPAEPFTGDLVLHVRREEP